MFRDCQFLTILISKSLSRAGVVQILATATSKNVPRLSIFNDFDFQIALARRRGANFVTSAEELIFPAGEATKLRKNTAFRALPTRQILMSHISAVSHLRDRISWLKDLQQQISV